MVDSIDSGTQPAVRVPPGVREDISGVRKIKCMYIYTYTHTYTASSIISLTGQNHIN